MATVPSYFVKFLKEIRPTQNQRDDCRDGHRTLRSRLHSDPDLKSLLVGTFLQGSYRRATAVRPSPGKNLDVDVIVVTRLDKERYPDPDDAMNLFVPFLDKHYKGKYERQGRSFGISLSYVDLDMVITSAPSEVDENMLISNAVTTDETLEEAEDWRLVKSWIPVSERNSVNVTEILRIATKEAEWKLEPLWIPDRDAGAWERTHPLEQIIWTAGKNRRCNSHFVNVVKAVKWWRRIHCSDLEYPKGYPVEHLVGVSCPDNITSVAQGVTLAFESIVRDYRDDVENGTKPFLPDHGVPEHDVFKRITVEDFALFYEHVQTGAIIAREALDAETVPAIEKWRELFGNKFPPHGGDDDSRDNDPKGPFIKSASEEAMGDRTVRRYGK